MTEATITCPNCHTQEPLTESLAAPLLAATRKQFELQLQQKDQAIALREQGIKDQEKQLAEAKLSLNEQVAQQVSKQLQTERQRVIEEETRKANPNAPKTGATADW
jgi:hypothetical protein